MSVCVCVCVFAYYINYYIKTGASPYHQKPSEPATLWRPFLSKVSYSVVWMTPFIYRFSIE